MNVVEAGELLELRTVRSEQYLFNLRTMIYVLEQSCLLLQPLSPIRNLKPGDP